MSASAGSDEWDIVLALKGFGKDGKAIPKLIPSPETCPPYDDFLPPLRSVIEDMDVSARLVVDRAMFRTSSRSRSFWLRFESRRSRGEECENSVRFFA